MSCLITFGRHRVAYSVLRSLWRNGVRVFVGDSIPYGMALSSRYASGRFRYRSPSLEKEFVSGLVREYLRRGCDALIPIHREGFLLSKYSSLLERKGVRTALPDYDTLLSVDDKLLLGELCRRVKVPYPETYLSEEYRGDLSYPLVVKTRVGYGSYGLSFVAAEKDLKKAIMRGREYSSEVIIQEYVAGSQLFVSGLFNRGELRDVACHRGVRGVPRYTNGATTLRVSLRCPLAEEYFRRFFESLSWHGVAQINFILGEKGVYVLDVNPRFWGGIFQTMQSGVEVPYHLFRMIVDGDTPLSGPQSDGVHTRWFWGDLAGLLSDLVGREKRALRDFISLKPGETWEDLDLSDPAPFFSATLPYLRFFLKMNPASWEKCYIDLKV